MSETACMATKVNGRRCTQKGTVFDPARGGLVCNGHAPPRVNSLDAFGYLGQMNLDEMRRAYERGKRRQWKSEIDQMTQLSLPPEVYLFNLGQLFDEALKGMESYRSSAESALHKTRNNVAEAEAQLMRELNLTESVPREKQRMIRLAIRMLLQDIRDKGK